MSVLVVGASGVLAPAVRSLTARGEPVLALARPSARLDALAAAPGVRALAIDLHDLDGLDRALTALPEPPASALVYCPTAPEGARERLLAAVTGRAVVLLTSAAADPARVGDDPARALDARARRTGEVRLLLGWAAGGPGGGGPGRWHAPEEVSGAALAALDSGTDAVLGRLRPWSDQPS